MRAHIIAMKSDPSSAVVFLISWKTTGKQMAVYHSELAIATCPVFPKKQMIICLEARRAQATFVGFGSS